MANRMQTLAWVQAQKERLPQVDVVWGRITDVTVDKTDSPVAKKFTIVFLEDQSVEGEKPLAVYFPARLINVSSSLQGQNLLVQNLSGKTVYRVTDDQVVLLVMDKGDYEIPRAYEKMQELKPTLQVDELAPAAEGEDEFELPPVPKSRGTKPDEERRDERSDTDDDDEYPDHAPDDNDEPEERNEPKTKPETTEARAFYNGLLDLCRDNRSTADMGFQMSVALQLADYILEHRKQTEPAGVQVSEHMLVSMTMTLFIERQKRHR